MLAALLRQHAWHQQVCAASVHKSLGLGADVAFLANLHVLVVVGLSVRELVALVVLVLVLVLALVLVLVLVLVAMRS